MNILLTGRGWDQLATSLQSSLPFQCDIRQWRPVDGDAKLATAVSGANVILVGADAALDGRILSTLGTVDSLKFLQLGFAGYDWLSPGMLPSGCVVANTHEHCSAIAEYVLGAVLDSSIEFRKIDADFRGGSWAYSGTTSKGIKHRSLKGKTVGIIGYGHIGQEVARRLESFGVRIVALGRAGKQPVPAPLDAYLGPADLQSFLAQSDFVVVACSLNEQTRDLIDGEAFTHLKRDAVLINVSRGPVVNEEALFAHLDTGMLRAAYIDVWYQYPTAETPSPRPSRLPFERLPNVVMTPHCSAWVEGQEEVRTAFLLENIRRFGIGCEVSSRILIG